jgi:hypothetical protein
LNKKAGCGTHAAPDPILRAGGGIAKTGVPQGTGASLLLPGFGLPLDADNAVASLYQVSRQYMRNPPTLLTAGNGPDILRANLKQQIQKTGPLLAAELRFRYRTESFVVNPGWLAVYMMEIYSLSSRKSEGGGPMVSSAEDSLDALWPEFRAAARGDMATFHNLIGCYNLHRSEGWPDHPYLFWSGGWGAPYRVHLYMCQLALTYSYFAELTDEDYGPLAMGEDNPCRGLGPFTEIMLDGYAVNILGDSSGECWLSISYQTKDARYSEQLHQRCNVGDSTCDQNYAPGCADIPWDEWEPEWAAYQACWKTEGRAAGTPPSACGPAAHERDFQVIFPPARATFDGFICDQILFLARMCLDYGRHPGPTINLGDFASYFLTARKIARYALRIIAKRSNTLIHEIGHILTAEITHCSAKCCMSAAGGKWECAVRGLLGLPDGEYYYSGHQHFGDYTNPNSISGTICHGCSDDSNVTQQMGLFRNTRQEGKPGQDVAFAATGCRNIGVFMRFSLLLLLLASCQPKSSPKDTTDSCGNSFDGTCTTDDYHKFKCGWCGLIYVCSSYGTDHLEWGPAGDRPCDCVTEEGTLDTTRDECRYDSGPD